jgi:hypothetical protein
MAAVALQAICSCLPLLVRCANVLPGLSSCPHSHRRPASLFSYQGVSKPLHKLYSQLKKPAPASSATCTHCGECFTHPTHSLALTAIHVAQRVTTTAVTRRDSCVIQPDQGSVAQWMQRGRIGESAQHGCGGRASRVVTATLDHTTAPSKIQASLACF